MDNEIENGFQELIEKSGEKVLIHTATCVEYKLTHDNCEGCISELGCSKLVSLLLVQMNPLLYQPKDFTDYELMQKSIQKQMAQIIEAKTVNEIHSII